MTIFIVIQIFFNKNDYNLSRLLYDIDYMLFRTQIAGSKDPRTPLASGVNPLHGVKILTVNQYWINRKSTPF
jgi:hypothetical protein